ncbi:hypothetical protein L9F63_010662, partial [Diploptera punctata]
IKESNAYPCTPAGNKWFRGVEDVPAVFPISIYSDRCFYIYLLRCSIKTSSTKRAMRPHKKFRNGGLLSEFHELKINKMEQKLIKDLEKTENR